MTEQATKPTSETILSSSPTSSAPPPLPSPSLQQEQNSNLDRSTSRFGGGSGSSQSGSVGVRKRATIIDEPDLEKGVGVTKDSEKRAKVVEKDVSDARLGLGGPFAGPPRRATMESRTTMRRSFTSLFQPEHRLKDPPNFLVSIKNLLLGSVFNVLLVFIPISWALHFAIDNDIAVFVTSFLAIMPLATILSQATEELSLRVGETIGGLINASLGNAVELIVAIVSLFNCELIIVQTSLLGSILSNLLLVLGMCFFAGGIKVKEQEFLATPAQLNTSLLMMSVISLVIPSAFHLVLGDIPDATERPDILKISRGVSILLLLIYFGFLYFSLFSHKELFEDEGGEEEEEEPQMNMMSVVVTLVVVTVLIGVTSEWLVTAIDGVSQRGVSKTWLGLILIPIASNSTEHIAAVIFSWKNKIQMAVSIAIGSSIQIALFVIPLLVTIGWMADKPLSMLFDPYATVLLFLSVLIVNFVIADSRSNWLEGFVLMMVYLVVALTVWFVPDSLSDQLFPDSLCT
ncbi:Calcium/proton exchanger [Violaceomyces palustris]|uniref:Calcium/proton exchanger n=1 Tax=Violaceomyces palustris TaxID=1673888 RepID=A0ACD0NWL2_9BASI|nr:Calcium/proton exchanger [Violaceomyces palustris]